MFNTFRKTGLLFLVVLILPTIIFSVYEFGSLKENENVIETIYDNQLEAILFSVNQYSDDAISSWAGKIENATIGSDELMLTETEKLMSELSPLCCVLQFDTNFNFIFGFPADSVDSYLTHKIRNILIANNSAINRLEEYLLNADYKRIISVENALPDKQLIVFATKKELGETSINALIIDPLKFINELLDPKIQEIAQNKFYIVSIDNRNDSVIYSSDKQEIPSGIHYSRPLSIIPRYSLGIELKDLTISELSRSHLKKDIAIIIIVDLVLILGIWIIYRNTRKQMELSQLKSDFVSNVSHEIRTPLALISMYIETLEMGRIKTKEKINEYYSIILQETQRLSGIVNKILNFSQIESGRRTYSFAHVNLNEIIEEVLKTYRFSLDSKGFEYSTELHNNISPIYADREAIIDALVNLIDNAIKYSERSKKIIIRTGEIHGEVFIEIEDSGIGISEKDQKYIFDKFYRVTEKNLAFKAKGSGLGLTIVKHIMDAHNGQIVIISQKDKGSVFRLIFSVIQKNQP